jgi:hypothetical protein
LRNIFTIFYESFSIVTTEACFFFVAASLAPDNLIYWEIFVLANNFQLENSFLEEKHFYWGFFNIRRRK